MKKERELKAGCMGNSTEQEIDGEKNNFYDVIYEEASKALFLKET